MIPSKQFWEVKHLWGMPPKNSGGSTKFPGGQKVIHRTAQTAFVRVVTPRNTTLVDCLFSHDNFDCSVIHTWGNDKTKAVIGGVTILQTWHKLLPENGSIVFAFQSSSLIQVFWVGGRGRGKGTVSINCLHLYVHVYVIPGEVSR